METTKTSEYVQRLLLIRS